jgi:hypothetical protein
VQLVEKYAERFLDSKDCGLRDVAAAIATDWVPCDDTFFDGTLSDDDRKVLEQLRGNEEFRFSHNIGCLYVVACRQMALSWLLASQDSSSSLSSSGPSWRIVTTFA